MDIRAELAKKIAEWLAEFRFSDEGDAWLEESLANYIAQKFDSVETFIEEEEVVRWGENAPLNVVAGIKVKLGKVGIDKGQ